VGRTFRGAACVCFGLLTSLLVAACGSVESLYGAGQEIVLGADVTLTPLPGLTPGATTDSAASPGFVAAVAANGGDVYVVDRVSGNVLRINLAIGTSDVVTTLVDPDTHGLFVSPDRMIFVVDKFRRSVRQVEDNGITVIEYADPANLSLPVDVAMTDWQTRIVVADGLAGHVLVFNSLGHSIDILGDRTLDVQMAQAVHTIAATNTSLFVLDPQLQEVLEFDLRGRPIGVYGENRLRQPVAMSVDQCGRLFIADQWDGSILVLSRNPADPGARVPLPQGRSVEITDLAVDENRLLVAVGSQGVIVLDISPPCT